VRVVERDADRLAPVLEDEHVADEVPGAELQVAILPDPRQVPDPTSGIAASESWCFGE